jgi:DNA mismatch endonuclease (patch repair protein)
MARDAATTSRIMGKVKRRDTKPELILRKALYRMGIRYRVDSKKVYGRPDVSIIKYRLAVFVDGDFWHGNAHRIRQLSRLEDLFPTNAEFWCSKILGNIERDRQVNHRLSQEGWTVIRIWASTILLDPNEAAESICKVLENLRASSSSMKPCLGPLS